MSITSKRVVLGGLAVASAVALLAGCASAPKSGTTTAKSSYLPCVIGDTGGFTDHSFNQLALDGVVKAANKIGSSYKKLQAKSANDYASGITSLIGEKCNIIAAPGFNFIASVKAAATANPKTNFAMIDDNSINLPNVKDIVFETDEAAFLGGYAAASYSKSGVVATWGGAEYPSVTIYMDGIADGIKYYNQQKGKNVKLLGWDVATQKGTFIGNFTDQNQAKTVTQNFLDQKADVVIPVAGSLYQGAAAAITGSNSSAVLEGVDADLYNTDPTYKSLFLLSILKKVDQASTDVVEAAASSKTFDNTTYVGTLKNGGVGISDFHDYASKVDPGLAGELATIKAGIIDGSIKVESPATFNK
ncbi:BMP family lipoprotein [Galbitalea soli]|uniref:BMP family ABC transporter substrate-binding protein n=1 Tax=Galbitalea soli TaxID=1268042 RepID=A0A7C9TQH1_9MICO|nr:BMP family ABC transporter substrate-binding protein [Galbitalea soli]NEM91298.1 BMP family ABC transporter substrate-binding protein [Galbitalea soli]NYJ29987.1 basic membrane protein A [Galbitalea soli]